MRLVVPSQVHTGTFRFVRVGQRTQKRACGWGRLGTRLIVTRGGAQRSSQSESEATAQGDQHWVFFALRGLLP